MDFNSSSFGFSDPSEFVDLVQSLTDETELVRLLTLASTNKDDDWRIPEAFVLWRLGRGETLLHYLNELPTSFHDDSSYWLLYGLALRLQSYDLSDIVNAYNRGLSLDSSRPDIHYNLANIFLDTDKSLALYHYQQSLLANSNQSYVWHNLGILLNSLDRHSEALLCLKNSIILLPTIPDVWCNLGLAFLGLEDYVSAESSFLQAIAIDKSNTCGVTNLGSLYISGKRFDEALRLLETPSTFSGGSSHALFNLGICHLLLGRFITGWKYYDERINTNLLPVECFPSSGPLLRSLDDAPLCGEHATPLIVWAEQGLGDCIQFSRYLLLLQEKNIYFEFHCSASLMPLISCWLDSSITVKELLPSQATSVKSIHCPLLSLPHLFSTDIHSIPSSIPYFSNTESSPSHLHVSKPPGGISIGLVWASHSDNTKMYRKKSISLDSLMPRLIDLVSLGLASINCLQVGIDQKQALPWLTCDGVVDWSPFLHDFSDTAFVLQQLDLVISVDTAVAHLSAALNKPTWILLPWDSDFRWLLSRNDSPWYPGTVRLFRQQTRSDWAGVMNDLFSALDDLFMLDLSRLASAKGHLMSSK